MTSFSLSEPKPGWLQTTEEENNMEMGKELNWPQLKASNGLCKQWSDGQSLGI